MRQKNWRNDELKKNELTGLVPYAIILAYLIKYIKNMKGGK